MPPLPPDLEERLRRHLAPDPAEAPERRAAVAMVLRLQPGAQSVLLMTRAEREDDPWSGQVSLPGGHRESGDTDLVDTAIRETREEVGLDLDRSGELLGRLAAVPARARGRTLSMDVTPFAFRLDAEHDPELAPGPEASEAFWLPLGPVVSGELDDEHRYERDGLVVRRPCWRFEDRVVWGLTYHMLHRLLVLAGALPPAPGD